LVYYQTVEPLEPGQRLGAFEIVRPLDAGGMGLVYEAVHTELGTRHAVKVFATESRRHDFLRKRFLVEGKLLAAFRHPNIVRVTDLQVDERSSTPYFAMDLVLSPDGKPLTLEGARQKGVDEDQVAGWLRDICDGLAYIHGKGVVHRDISLENVMVGPDGHAIITDFGISRIFDGGLRQRVDLTRFTMVELGTTELKMGKVPYMAPELTRKMPAHASPASDAYALGVLVFRLLTGFWFERDNRKNSMEMLAGMKYGWSALLNRLLDERPSMRLPKDGIAAVPNLLKPPKQRNDARQNAIAAALLLVLIATGAAFWLAKTRFQDFTRTKEPLAVPAANLAMPTDKVSTNTVFRKRSKALQEAMKNGIITPGPPQTDEPEESGK